MMTKIQLLTRPAGYQVPFITSARDGSNFPGEKCRLCFSPFHSGTVFTHAETAIQQVGFLAKNKAIKLKNIAYVSG